MDKYTSMMKGAPGKKANITQARESLGKSWQARDLEGQQSRRWKQGDVYAPHDLSSVEMRKWKRRGRPTTDAFDALAMNPLNEYKVCHTSFIEFSESEQGTEGIFRISQSCRNS